MFSGALDLNFDGKWKRDAESCAAKDLDLLRCPRFLGAKLVTGDRQYREIHAPELIMKALQLLVLGRVPTFAGHIYQQYDFAPGGPQQGTAAIQRG